MVIFCCPFRASGLELAVENGELKIKNEGQHCKFTAAIPQVAFHGPGARGLRQTVWYVTERAVFRLREGGLDLVEVAPGIDVEKDICQQMEFRPNIGEVKTMPTKCFDC